MDGNPILIVAANREIFYNYCATKKIDRRVARHVSTDDHYRGYNRDTKVVIVANRAYTMKIDFPFIRAYFNHVKYDSL